MNIRKISYVRKENINKLRLWKDKNGIFLSTLSIELTERCNNNCIHCYINLPSCDLTAAKKELSTEEIKEILKEAVSLSCVRLVFTGGEPLLRKDFEELYVYARKLGLRISLLTNATLINPHFAKLFSQIPPLEKIEITVYGMKKNSYEAITRKRGSFAAAWRGINLLIKCRIPFLVKGVLLPHNRSEMEEFESWAKGISWMDKPPTYSMFFDLRCRRDSKDKNMLIKSLRVSPEDGLMVFAKRKDEYIKEMKIFCSKFTKIPGKNIFNCGLGFRGGNVDAYGNFQPCLMLRHPDTGYEVRNGFLKDALSNFFPKLREVKSGNPEYLSRCAKCFLKGICEQCPAKSWIEHGTLDTPVEYLCAIAHAKARFLGLLRDNEKAWKVVGWEERVKEFTDGNSALTNAGECVDC